MDQETFNEMLKVALAQMNEGGYYVHKYSGEEIDTLLDYVSQCKEQNGGS